MKTAYIFHLGREYRIIVKTDGKRTDDRRFDGPSEGENAHAALTYVQENQITERFICDTREYDPETI